jgi:hypothetical protein
MTCKPQSRIATFLRKRDAEHIHADKQRETANSNREVDLMHSDLSETALFSACDSREPLLPGRCYPTRPITVGPFWSRSDPKGAGKTADGRYAADLFLQLPTVPLRLSALSRLTYCYLRTTTEAIARLYRVIVLREDRIPQSEWSDYTLVYS